MDSAAASGIPAGAAQAAPAGGFALCYFCAVLAASWMPSPTF